jgi:hypothetical protein
MACALLVSAFAAQGASAITGTTAFTCVSGSTNDFSENHCKTKSVGGGFGHTAIAQDTTTKLSGDDAGGVSVLKATVGGIPVTLTAQNLSAAASPQAWMKNQVAANGEHFAHGEGKITYEEVTVTGAGKECFVYEDVGPAPTTPGEKGMVTTELLTATTQGQGDSLKFTPAAAGAFAKFWITDGTHSTTNCVTGGTYEVSGSVTGVPSGATVNFVHNDVTTANTLTLGKTGGTGFKAGLNGSLTLKAEGTPLSPTTVTT